MPAPRTRTTLMAAILLVAMALFGYALAEAATRIAVFPKSGTGAAMQELAAKLGAKLAETPSLEEIGKKESWNPQTGWGIDKAQTYTTLSGPAKHVVLVGDSVTAGHGVSPSESYAALWQQTLAPQWFLANWASNGFGVDQMLLKLQARKAELEDADAIIFAYIPHNLIRPANNYLYGVTKPRYNAKTDSFTPTQPMQDFLDSYHSARRFGYLGPWLAWRYWSNKEYYAPQFFHGYYAALYAHVAKGLSALATEKRPVIVLRLTNYLPFKNSADLQNLWNTALEQEAAANPHLSLYNMDACILPLAKQYGLDAAHEFDFHPRTTGHALYAQCLATRLTLPQ